MSQIRRLTAILAADVAGYSRLMGADEAAASSELTEIAGVDAADGLHRVGGNLRLHRAMLQQYAEDQAETPAALRAALADGDAKTAERLAHTLKGVSATLGINTAEGSVSQRHCPEDAAVVCGPSSQRTCMGLFLSSGCFGLC